MTYSEPIPENLLPAADVGGFNGKRARWIRRRSMRGVCDVAAQMGVSHQYIVQLEQKRHWPITAHTANRLAKALGVSPDELVGHSERREENGQHSNSGRHARKRAANRHNR